MKIRLRDLITGRFTTIKPPKTGTKSSYIEAVEKKKD